MSDAHSFCLETNKGISVEDWNWLSKRLAAHHSEWTDRLGPEKLQQIASRRPQIGENSTGQQRSGLACQRADVVPNKSERIWNELYLF